MSGDCPDTKGFDARSIAVAIWFSALLTLYWLCVSAGVVRPMFERIVVNAVIGILVGIFIQRPRHHTVFGVLAMGGYVLASSFSWMAWGGDSRGIVRAFLDNTFFRFHDYIPVGIAILTPLLVYVLRISFTKKIV